MLTDRVVDQVMASASPIVAADSVRRKVASYIALLASAGKRDAEELTALGLAYLREILEGSDTRFTGW